MRTTNEYCMVVVFQDGDSIEVDAPNVKMLGDDILSFADINNSLKAIASIPSIKYVICKKRGE